VSRYFIPNDTEKGKKMQIRPQPLDTYFEAVNEQNKELFIKCFTKDAIVHDDDKIHVGYEEIASWNAAAIEKYNCSYEVLKCTATPQGADVTAKVSGTFQGSPVDLTYGFVLKDNLIKELGIK
jgi:hypothetical protein